MILICQTFLNVVKCWKNTLFLQKFWNLYTFNIWYNMNTHSKCFLTERYNIKDAIYILNRHHWIKIHRFIQESAEPPPSAALRAGGRGLFVFCVLPVVACILIVKCISCVHYIHAIHCNVWNSGYWSTLMMQIIVHFYLSFTILIFMHH